MDIFTLIVAGIAPSLALLSFFYLKDRFNPEPLSLVIKVFLFGILVVVPIMFFQYVLNYETSEISHFVQAIFISSFPEELAKWLLFFVIVFFHKEFDEPVDGIIYAVAISLGFATLENVLYLVSFGIEYALPRAFFPVSSHCLFGVIMGFFMGKAKFQTENKHLYLVMSFLIPFILHGAYDYLVKIKGMGIYLIVFMIAFWLISMFSLRRLLHDTESELLASLKNSKKLESKQASNNMEERMI